MNTENNGWLANGTTLTSDNHAELRHREIITRTVALNQLRTVRRFLKAGSKKWGAAQKTFALRFNRRLLLHQEAEDYAYKAAQTVINARTEALDFYRYAIGLFYRSDITPLVLADTDFSKSTFFLDPKRVAEMMPEPDRVSFLAYTDAYNFTVRLGPIYDPLERMILKNPAKAMSDLYAHVKNTSKTVRAARAPVEIFDLWISSLNAPRAHPRISISTQKLLAAPADDKIHQQDRRDPDDGIGAHG